MSQLRSLTTKNPNLIIPVGIPGCGKSTYGRLMDARIVSTDAIRKDIFGSLVASHDVEPEEWKRRNDNVFNLFHQTIEEYLTDGTSVYADATNLQQYARRHLKDIADFTRAKTYVILFNNLAQAMGRNSSRNEDAIVPDLKMRDFLEQHRKVIYDVYDEGHEQVIRIERVG